MFFVFIIQIIHASLELANHHQHTSSLLHHSHTLEGQHAEEGVSIDRIHHDLGEVSSGQVSHGDDCESTGSTACEGLGSCVFGHCHLQHGSVILSSLNMSLALPYVHEVDPSVGSLNVPAARSLEAPWQPPRNS